MTINDPMLDKLIEVVKKNNLNPTQTCFYLGISPATWNRWLHRRSFTKQLDRLQRVHDFIQNPQKYIQKVT